jgi:hypothetical protein
MSDGTLFFVSNRRGGVGGWDIYRSPLKDGRYSEAELPGPPKYRWLSTINQEGSLSAAAGWKLPGVLECKLAQRFRRNGFVSGDAFQEPEA